MLVVKEYEKSIINFIKHMLVEMYIILMLSTLGIQDDNIESCRTAFFEKDTKGVIEYCTPLALNGNDTAQSYLGIIYLFNDDVENAQIWFEKSANLGNSDGQNGLGYLYQMGYGVDKNIELANKWFLKSAKQGNSDSQFWLGEIYF